MLGCMNPVARDVTSLVAAFRQPARHDFPFFAAQLNAAIGALLSGCLLTVMPKDWPPHESAVVIRKIPLPRDTTSPLTACRTREQALVI